MSESPRSTAAVRKVLALRDHRVEFIALVVAVVGGTYALSYWLSQNYHLSDTDRDMFTLLAKVALGAVFFLATHLYGASGRRKWS